MPSMNRRNFLRAAFNTTLVGTVATPALAELFTPKRTIFLPPRGGWLPSTLANHFLRPYEGQLFHVTHVPDRARMFVREGDVGVVVLVDRTDLIKVSLPNGDFWWSPEHMRLKA